MVDLTKITIKQSLNLLAKKEISAVELTQFFLNRIRAANNTLNAYVEITEQLALEKAKISDQNIAKNQARVLEGLPIAVKDNFCTKNVRTTNCSRILENFIPTYESTVTENLFNSGTIMLGKTNMDEFAMGSSNLTSYFGAVNGPWKNPQREYTVPGGSSGGSAAAVAASLALAALGTDTGGSVRQPASYTGIVGLKPSYGRCSRWGIMAFASSLDQAGVLAKNVEDSAIMLQAMMSNDPKDATIAKEPIPDITNIFNNYDLKSVKIGIPKEYNVNSMPDEIKQAWSEGMKFLENAGAIIEEVSLPHTEYGLSAYYVIAPAEASSNLARYDGVRYGLKIDEGGSLDEMYELTRSAGFGEEVKRRIIMGTYVLSSKQYEEHFLQAQKVRRLIANDFAEVFKDFTAILTPTTISEAFSVNSSLSPIEMYKNDIFTIPASLAGLPAISIPAKLSKNKLPLGLQVITNRFDEVNLLKIAKILEDQFKFNATPGENNNV